MDNNKPVTELPVKAPFDFAKWWDRVGILIVLLVLLILMSTFAPNFNRVDNLLNIARSISVNAILAAGMTFVILTSGIDLSVGSIVAVSGVVSWSRRWPGPCAAGDSGRRWRGRAVRSA
jgi:ribose transport system permease protein